MIVVHKELEGAYIVTLRALCCSGDDGGNGRSLDGLVLDGRRGLSRRRSGCSTIRGRVLEGRDRGRLLDLRWVLVDLSRCSNLGFGLCLEEFTDARGKAATKLGLFLLILLLLLLLFLLVLLLRSCC